MYFALPSSLYVLKQNFQKMLYILISSLSKKLKWFLCIIQIPSYAGAKTFHQFVKCCYHRTDRYIIQDKNGNDYLLPKCGWFAHFKNRYISQTNKQLNTTKQPPGHTDFTIFYEHSFHSRTTVISAHPGGCFYKLVKFSTNYSLLFSFLPKWIGMSSLVTSHL